MIDFLAELFFYVILEGLGAIAKAIFPENDSGRAKKILRTVLVILTFVMFLAIIAGVFLMIDGKLFVPGIIMTAVGVVYCLLLIAVKLISRNL